MTSDTALIPLAPLRKSSRTIIVPTKFNDYIVSKPAKALCSQVFNVYTNTQLQNFSTAYLATLARVLSVHEPASYFEAKKNQKWVVAMNDELAALDKNNTWNLVPLPSGKSAIGCR